MEKSLVHLVIVIIKNSVKIELNLRKFGIWNFISYTRLMKNVFFTIKFIKSLIYKKS